MHNSASYGLFSGVNIDGSNFAEACSEERNYVLAEKSSGIGLVCSGSDAFYSGVQWQTSEGYSGQWCCCFRGSRQKKSLVGRGEIF